MVCPQTALEQKVIDLCWYCRRNYGFTLRELTRWVYVEPEPIY